MPENDTTTTPRSELQRLIRGAIGASGQGAYAATEAVLALFHRVGWEDWHIGPTKMERAGLVLWTKPSAHVEVATVTTDGAGTEDEPAGPASTRYWQVAYTRSGKQHTSTALAEPATALGFVHWLAGLTPPGSDVGVYEVTLTETRRAVDPSELEGV